MTFKPNTTNNLDSIKQTKERYDILKLIYTFSISIVSYMPVPVVAWSKVYVYGLSPTVIVGLNPTEGMDICLL
jgi:hypothetical protein